MRWLHESLKNCKIIPIKDLTLIRTISQYCDKEEYEFGKINENQNCAIVLTYFCKYFVEYEQLSHLLPLSLICQIILTCDYELASGTEFSLNQSYSCWMLHSNMAHLHVTNTESVDINSFSLWMRHRVFSTELLDSSTGTHSKITVIFNQEIIIIQNRARNKNYLLWTNFCLYACFPGSSKIIVLGINSDEGMRDLTW